MRRQKVQKNPEEHKGPSQPEKTARGVLTNLFFGQKKAAKKTKKNAEIDPFDVD